MNNLSRAQLDLVAQHIRQMEPHRTLQAELVDHVASQIEQRMAQGQAFPDAFDAVTQQTNPQAFRHLKQLYLRELNASPARLTASRVGIRSRRRPAPKPLQYTLFASVLALLFVMGCLVLISRSFAMPIDGFRMVGAIGLAGTIGLLVVRWWLTRQPRKSKRLVTA